MTPPADGYRARLLVAQYTRWRRSSALLVWLFLGGVLLIGLLGILAQRTPQPDTSKLGVHLLLDDGRTQWDVAQWAEHLDAARTVTGSRGWVVQLIREDDRDIAKWRRFIALCADRGLTPILRLATTFDRAQGWWRVPTADADGRYHTWASTWTEFVASIYDASNLQPYVIVLNEPNNGLEWGGRADAAAYARLYTDTRAALRTRLNTSVVLNGALDLYAANTGTGINANGMSSLDANTFLDVFQATEPQTLARISLWNSHAYPSGFTATPDVQSFGFNVLNDGSVNAAQPPVGVVNRGINGYTWELWKLQTLGATPDSVFISETGWRQGAEFVSGEDQARLWAIALQGNTGLYADLPNGGWTPLLRDPRVVGVVWFALDGNPTEWAHSSALEMRADGTIAGSHPVYTLQQTLIAP